MKRKKLTKKIAKEVIHDAWKKLESNHSFHKFVHLVSIELDEEYAEFTIDGSSIKLKLSQAKIDTLKAYKEMIYAERGRDIE
jgi:hypothetical protein